MTKTILITGAAGFIGRHCVLVARKRGHRVIAMVRRDASKCSEWTNDPLIDVVLVDLADEGDQAELAKAMSEATTVIHAAASLAGSAKQQERDTVVATQNLIGVMAGMAREKRKLVLVSSFAVYDMARLPEGARLDETSPIINSADAHSTYSQTKRAQETLTMQAADDGLLDLFIMRPGSVFGGRRLWNGHLGYRIGSALVRVGMDGVVPVSYVENCALALVLAAETPLTGVETINVIDDDLPNRTTYISTLKSAGLIGAVVPLSWRILAKVGAALGAIPQLRSKLPGLLRPAVLRSRMMSLEYSNKKLKQRLGWKPEFTYETAMLRSLGLQSKDKKP